MKQWLILCSLTLFLVNILTINANALQLAPVPGPVEPVGEFDSPFQNFLDNVGPLDLPGYAMFRWDDRLNGNRSEADNARGRFIGTFEQGFSTKRLSPHIMAVAGYSLYDPNLRQTDNYGWIGLRNKSLLRVFTLDFHYEAPMHQVAGDMNNRWVVQIGYEKEWNLAK